MALINPETIRITPEPLPLRTLDESEQRTLAGLLPTLDGAVLDLATGEQFRLKARLVQAGDGEARDGQTSDRSARGPWLTGPTTQPALHIGLWDGTATILHAERIADIAALLTGADALLSALERRIGTAIEPDQLQDEAPTDAHIIALDFYDKDGLRHQLTLAFPPAFEPPIDAGQSDLNMTRATVATTLEAVVASLDIDDASAIGAGDLLILRGGNWGATLGTAFGAVSGRLDPFNNFFSVGNGDPAQEQSGMSDEETGGDGGFGALKVPVSIKLPDQGLTIEELGKLRAGLAVPVGPIAAGLEVQLTVAGRTIAIGELVRLGDQFAVHIDRIPQDTLPPQTEQAIEMPDQSGGAAGADPVAADLSHYDDMQ